MQQGNNATKSQLKKRYLSNIRNLVSILNGKSKNLVSVLNKKMDQAVKLENFEDAILYRNQIQRLNYITKPNHFSLFLENPNFFEEEQKKEVEELEKILFFERSEKFSAKASNNNLFRIECYDISNLSSQFATGSMVVFINGIADKTQYRRFKINLSCHSSESGNPDLPNDPGMIAEVLTRRLKHKEWPYPDLIVVDGGKPQVSAALKVLQDYKIKIPVIGLAKREEEIIWKLELGAWSLTNLPSNSPALNLLKRLRDETHRFGLKYHRQLRKKAFLTS